MASHPGARNAQSLFQKPSRNHGFIAAGLPRYAESSRTHLGLPAPVSISECPFIYVRPYIFVFLQLQRRSNGRPQRRLLIRTLILCRRLLARVFMAVWMGKV